jgi:hypothetical protein
VHHEVSRFRQHRSSVCGNQNTPRRVGRADHFSQITTHFFGVRINGADYFQRGLLTHQTDNGRADGTNSVLNDPNFLFHDGFP